MTEYTKFNPDELPPPLMTSEPDSFARKTMTERLPSIVQDVLHDHENDYPIEIQEALQALHQEMVNNEPVSPLNTTAPDREAWYEAWVVYRDKGWLEIPWYFGESFFYRRLLQASGYFGWPVVAMQQRPPTLEARAEVEAWQGVDPFLPRKQAELKNEATWQVVEAAQQVATTNQPDNLGILLHYAVWGNRLDLSYTQAAESAGKLTIEEERENMVIDRTEAVVNYLQECKNRVAPDLPHIQMICDNAGLELLMDLVLVDFLLRFEWAGQVTLHVKAHPTFVSDTTAADIFKTMMALEGRGQPATTELGQRLSAYEANLQVKSASFWNSSHFFWELPATLRKTLSEADLIIFKGDANYRRLLGDSGAWRLTVPLGEAVPYMPAPFVTLRTLKSPPIVGLASGQAESLDAEDTDWRISGKRGLVDGVMGPNSMMT